MSRKQIVAALVLLPFIVFAFMLLLSGSRDVPGAFLGGGPFISGELYTGPEPDWSFLIDRETVEMQLLEPPRSRVVWVAVHEGKPYVVSGFMGGLLGSVWKHWPEQALRDGRAILRVDGRHYERQLVRITSGRAVMEGVSAELNRKYGFGEADSIEAGATWLFELALR